MKKQIKEWNKVKVPNDYWDKNPECNKCEYKIFCYTHDYVCLKGD